jgi:hypothetical protein
MVVGMQEWGVWKSLHVDLVYSCNRGNRYLKSITKALGFVSAFTAGFEIWSEIESMPAKISKNIELLSSTSIVACSS